MPRILVVDDDVQIRQLVSVMLRHEGWGVLAAADGNSALRACWEEEFALVLCDIFMPGRDGLETMQELRRAFPGQKIVAMSGAGAVRGRMDVFRAARLMGAGTVLAKPFSRQELLAVIDEALAASAAVPMDRAPPAS